VRGACCRLPTSRSTPPWHRQQPVPPVWFGLFPVRSPLLRESSLFLGVREMFQFPRFPPHRCGPALRQGVAPFGHHRIIGCQHLPDAFRCVATSFIGPRRLGIHHVLFSRGCPPSSQSCAVFVVRAETSETPPRSQRLWRHFFPCQGPPTPAPWSRGDSNPGPPPCKGGALPAELRPPSSPRGLRPPVGAPGLEPGTSALSGPRSHHLSYAPAAAVGPAHHHARVTLRRRRSRPAMPSQSTWPLHDHPGVPARHAACSARAPPRNRCPVPSLPRTPCSTVGMFP
jgi:hypothetical protein